MTNITFLLDTNVLSHSGLEQAPSSLKDWMADVGFNSMALCFPVLAEIQRGRELKRHDDPEAFLRHSEWLADLLDRGYIYAHANAVSAITYAKMTVVDALSHLRTDKPWQKGQKREKLGHDLIIASIAIAHGMAVATFDIRDFLLINSYFPLPGLFHPIKQVWFVEPPSQFELVSPDVTRTGSWMLP